MAAVDMSADFGYEYVRVNLDFEMGQELPHPYAWVPLGETQVQKFAHGEHAVLMISFCGCGIPYQLLAEGEMDGHKLFFYRRVKNSERDAILIRRVQKVPYVTWVDLVLLFQCIGSESICCKENLGDHQNESAGRIQACLSVEVLQCSAEYVKDGLTIQLTNMTGDVVYTGKFKDDLNQMRLSKMEERARFKAASSIGLSYMRPLKLCGKGGQVLGRKLKVHIKKPLMLPKFRVINKTPHALLKFLHYEVVPNNVDHAADVADGDKEDFDEFSDDSRD